MAIILAACLGISLLSGCGGEEEKIYAQAVKDLQQGTYQYALQGFEKSIENGTKLPHSYRGAGISCLRLGEYTASAEYFSNALDCENLGKTLKRDLYAYRATAYMKAGALKEAMADCQTLAAEYSMDADLYFLTGKVALNMDSYEEASANFESAYAEDETYDMAIRIYETYLEKDMEADGTKYLEAALSEEPENAQDHCDRGRVYYYMDDYENARKELIEASNNGNTQALLLLGMVYTAQKDISNARAMYQEYIDKAEDDARGYNGLALCDISEKNYDAALENIASGIAAADTEEIQSLLFNEIVAYERKLDFSTALTKVKEYLDMFPEDEAAQKEKIFLETRITDAGSAAGAGTADTETADSADGQQDGQAQSEGAQ